MATDDVSFKHSAWKIFVTVYSVITISTAVAAVMGYIPVSVFFFLFIIYVIFSSSLGRKAFAIESALTDIVKEVEVMHRVMRWIEDKKFSSELLQKLQQSVTESEEKAYIKIKKLKSLLDRFDLRFNWFLFPFINGFLLWDVRQIIALNEWKQKNREQIPYWYELIAQIEVMNSLATVHFNYPDWTIPRFSKEHFILEAKL